MSVKAALIKTAIKLTPKGLVRWGINSRLKGIAQVKAYDFNLDTRRAYGRVHLIGEAEPIEVLVENFGVLRSGEGYVFVIRQAKSNRIWLDNVLAKIVGRAWEIPAVPQLARFMPLVDELLGMPE